MNTEKIAVQDDQHFQYNNQKGAPEFNLALYIVGVLAAQGLIVVENKNKDSGFENFEHATEVVAKCLRGMHDLRPDVSLGDQIFDFVMSKP